jgi:glutathione S-transferase
MLKLYVKTGCPYCARVLEELRTEKIPFTEFNIKEKQNADTVIALGGKCQVPFLVDEKVGISMYESSMIIDYLNRNYVKKPKGKSNLAPGRSDTKTCSSF